MCDSPGVLLDGAGAEAGTTGTSVETGVLSALLASMSIIAFLGSTGVAFSGGVGREPPPAVIEPVLPSDLPPLVLLSSLILPTVLVLLLLPLEILPLLFCP